MEGHQSKHEFSLEKTLTLSAEIYENHSCKDWFCNGAVGRCNKPQTANLFYITLKLYKERIARGNLFIQNDRIAC